MKLSTFIAYRSVTTNMHYTPQGASEDVHEVSIFSHVDRRSTITLYDQALGPQSPTCTVEELAQWLAGRGQRQQTESNAALAVDSINLETPPHDEPQHAPVGGQ